MSIFLGIDGGGTQTTCIIGDETSVLATATTGPSNVVRVGEERARDSLRDVVQQACAAAGANPAEVKRACIGLAGAARPEIVSLVRSFLSDLLPEKLAIVGDMEIALQAAFGDGPGIIVNAGTGSFAYGRDRAGRTARVGGWGFAISDEGSGHWIGRSAVSAAFRARDDGEPSSLLEEIVNAWKLSTPDDLVRSANGSPPPDFSAIFPVTLALADAGDSVARSVLSHAGAELARLVRLVILRLFPSGDDVPVAMTGSVLRQSALVREVFYNDLQIDCPCAVPNSTIIEPVKGALELARKAAEP